MAIKSSKRAPSRIRFHFQRRFIRIIRSVTYMVQSIPKEMNEGSGYQQLVERTDRGGSDWLGLWRRARGGKDLTPRASKQSSNYTDSLPLCLPFLPPLPKLGSQFSPTHFPLSRSLLSFSSTELYACSLARDTFPHEGFPHAALS